MPLADEKKPSNGSARSMFNCMPALGIAHRTRAQNVTG